MLKFIAIQLDRTTKKSAEILICRNIGSFPRVASVDQVLPEDYDRLEDSEYKQAVSKQKALANFIANALESFEA